MICQQCHKNTATQVVRVVRNGKSTELEICNECAKSHFPLPEVLSSLTDILLNIVNEISPSPLTLKKVAGGEDSVAPPPSASSAPSCRTCGLTRDALVEQRRFGCPDCYTAFPDDVATFLQELQYGERHIGRVPRFARLRHRVAELKRELAKAIDANDFTNAAQVRDKIRELQN